MQQARPVVALVEVLCLAEPANRDYSFVPEMEVEKQESIDNIVVAVAAVADIRVAYLPILLAVYHFAPLSDLS